MRIQALEVEAFRGFAARRRFEFAGVQVLLLYGPNGHGKTSFFDAIEWALTGEICRYQESTDERKQARFVGNLFAGRKGRDPRVCLELLDAAGQRIMITRVGTAAEKAQSDYGESQLVLEGLADGPVTGAEAERMLRELLVQADWRSKVEMPRGLQLTHVLGQEQINRFLRGMKGKERYNAISVLSGTADFTRYKDLFTETQRELESQCKEIDAKLKESTRHYNDSLHRVEELESRYAWDRETVPVDEAKQVIAECLTELKLDEAADVDNEKGMRRMVEQHREQWLAGRRDYLLHHQEPLQIAVGSLPEWKQAVYDLEQATDRLANLERTADLAQRLREVAWLSEQFALYAEGPEKRRAEKLARIEQLMAGREELHSQVVAFSKYAGLAKHLLLKVQNGDVSAHEALTQLRAESGIPEVHQQKILSYFSQVADSLALVAFKQKDVERTQFLVDEYKQLHQVTQAADEQHVQVLNQAHAFVASREHLDSCPVCGTEGIGRDHLLRYVEQEMGQHGAHLAEVARKLRRLEDQLIAERLGLGKRKHEHEIDVKELEHEISSLQQMAEIHEESIDGLRIEVLNIREEIDEIDQLTQTFRERSQRLGLNPATLDQSALSALERELQQAADLALAAISESDQANIPLAIEVCKQAVQRAESEAAKLPNRLRELGADPAEAGRWNAAQVEQFLNDLTAKHQAYLHDIEARDKLIGRALTAFEQLDRYQELVRVRQQMQGEHEHIQHLQQQRAKIAEALDIVKESLKSIPQAVDRLNEQAITKLFTTIQDLFARLNSHPLYRTLDFKRGLRYGSNNLTLTALSHTDDGTDVAANPSFIFSAAQVNAIALSFFLAMALHQQWSPLQLIAMDDPVQSMDDLNVAALVDLIRVLCDHSGYGKQFIISTHDPAFHNLMRRKFRFLSVGVIEYEGYGEQGPLLSEYSDGPGEPHCVRRIDPQPMHKLAPDVLSL